MYNSLVNIIIFILKTGEMFCVKTKIISLLDLDFCPFLFLLVCVMYPEK